MLLPPRLAPSTWAARHSEERSCLPPSRRLTPSSAAHHRPLATMAPKKKEEEDDDDISDIVDDAEDEEVRPAPAAIMALISAVCMLHVPDRACRSRCAGGRGDLQ